MVPNFGFGCSLQNPSHPYGGVRRFRWLIFFGCNVTESTPHTALKYIPLGKLTFADRAVLHRVESGLRLDSLVDSERESCGGSSTGERCHRGCHGPNLAENFHRFRVLGFGFRARGATIDHI